MEFAWNSDRTRSPTSWMIAPKSSCLASASPISLMTASSAARWFVSASSRFVSSNRRAFSSATPMPAASVARTARRTPCRRRGPPTRGPRTPMTRFAPRDRNADPRLGVDRPDRDRPGGIGLVAGSHPERAAGLDDAGRQADPERLRNSRRRSARPSSMAYGQVTMLVAASWRAMNMKSAANCCLTRSPTSWMIASKSSCLPSASPISLMTASSAARWLVSARRRFVSSNRRALLEGDADARCERREQPLHLLGELVRLGALAAR